MRETQRGNDRDWHREAPCGGKRHEWQTRCEEVRPCGVCIEWNAGTCIVPKVKKTAETKQRNKCGIRTSQREGRFQIALHNADRAGVVGILSVGSSEGAKLNVARYCMRQIDR